MNLQRDELCLTLSNTWYLFFSPGGRISVSPNRPNVFAEATIQSAARVHIKSQLMEKSLS